MGGTKSGTKAWYAEEIAKEKARIAHYKDYIKQCKQEMRLHKGVNLEHNIEFANGQIANAQALIAKLQAKKASAPSK